MYLYPSLRTLLVWALLLLSWLLRAAAGPTGHWEGRIDLGNNGLPVIVDLVRNAAPGPATFKGTLSEDATRLAGTVSNADGLPLTFRRQN